MVQYRRNRVAGGSYFFTVTLQLVARIRRNRIRGSTPPPHHKRLAASPLTRCAANLFASALACYLLAGATPLPGCAVGLSGLRIAHRTFGLMAVFNAMPCCGMLLAGGVQWCNIGETAWRVAATFLPSPCRTGGSVIWWSMWRGCGRRFG